jgi:NAD(P)H-quinone oxidoreductase subunit 6
MDQLLNITNWLTNNAQGVETLFFYVLAILAIPFAYGVIFDRGIIRSGFLLIGVFGAVSGLFLILQAQFLAMAQIMIYAVGITLVVVIALMLTNPKLENELAAGVNSQNTWHTFCSFVFALLFFVTIYMAIRSEGWPVSPMTAPDANNIFVIGQALTRDYALPFEFSSVLLLAALIGAIMLAKAERPEDAREYEEDSESSTEPAEAYTTTSR